MTDLMAAIVDRPQRDRARAGIAAWMAFMVALLVGRDIDDAGSFVVAGVGGAAIVLRGFAAASGVRSLPRRDIAQRVRLTLLAIAAGAGLGLANVAANWLIAGMHPLIRAALVERFVALRPLDALVAAPIVEEVEVRLFLMSALAWILARVTRRGDVALGLALIGSAMVFAALHLARPLPLDPALANLYRAALIAKYTMAGLGLGWIFWRWGLPYAILCHAAVNAAHLALQNRVF